MTPEAWAFLGVAITALCGVAIALINQRKTSGKLTAVAADAKATRNQVSNGQTTLMRDDLVQVRDMTMCIQGKVTSLCRSVETIQARQIVSAQEVAEIRERVRELSDDVDNCPQRRPPTKINVPKRK